MKLLHGLGYVVDKNWRPRDFADIDACRRYGEQTMPDDLKQSGFNVVISASFTPGAVRLNYAKRILKE